MVGKALVEPVVHTKLVVDVGMSPLVPLGDKQVPDDKELDDRELVMAVALRILASVVDILAHRMAKHSAI